MENQTCDWEQMRGRPWVGTHANWETSRKCWHMINLQGVRCVYEGGLHLSDPTHVHTRCVTHLLPRYAGDVFFIFSADRVSCPRFGGQWCSAALLPVSWSCLLLWVECALSSELSSLLWSGAGEVWMQEAVAGTETTGGCLTNLWRIWKLPSHCDAVPSIWKESEAAAGGWLKLSGR